MSFNYKPRYRIDKENWYSYFSEQSLEQLKELLEKVEAFERSNGAKLAAIRKLIKEKTTK